MKILLIALVILLLALQYRLWIGEGSLAHVSRLSQEIEKQQAENNRLKLKNQYLSTEVDALRNGYDAIEAKAREELGLIKKGETFFLFIEDDKETPEQ